MKIAVSITGASGIIYGIRLLEELNKKNCEAYAIVSDHAKKIMDYELNMKYTDVEKLVENVYTEDDMNSPLASGSFYYDAMILCPCSIKSMAAVANGLAMNLITRAALCCLKEGRKLIVVPRETPLDSISLKNMVSLKNAGVTILPAMPAFYHKPKKIDDLVNYVIGKIMEQIGINHDLYEKWE